MHNDMVLSKVFTSLPIFSREISETVCRFHKIMKNYFVYIVLTECVKIIVIEYHREHHPVHLVSCSHFDTLLISSCVNVLHLCQK